MAEKLKKRKVPAKRDDFFTIREIELLAALSKFKIVKEAATDVGLSYDRAERILANIRKKWHMSVNTNNRILSIIKTDQTLRRLLYTPVRRPPKIETIE